MREKIVKNLKEARNIHELAILLNIIESSEFISLQKELVKMEEDTVIFLDGEDKYHLIDNIKYHIGEVRDRKRYLEVDGLYILNNRGVISEDLVLYEVIKGSAHIIKVIKHRIKYVIGIIRFKKKELTFYSDDIRFKDYHLIKDNKIRLANNMKIRAIIIDYDRKLLRFESVIGNIKDRDIYEKSILASHMVKTEFDKTVINECTLFDEKINPLDYPNRKNLTDELIFTIDGDDAKDFDDAISLETYNNGYILKVHIADVSEYVKPYSALDKEANVRGTSIYYANKVIPMLPEVLSNGLCSLRPNEDRLVLTVEMKLDQEANVLESEIYESIIKSKFRLTYREVNAYFDGKFEYPSYLSDSLDKMKELASKLIDKKNKKGAIEFKEEDVYFIFDKDKVVDIRLRNRGFSERLIESFMILANEEVATLMHQISYPIIYRNHDYPKSDRIKQFIEEVESLGYVFHGNKNALKPQQLSDCLKYFEGSELEYIISKLLLRSMSKANYDVESIGHYGLALEHYSHFTSPIRRYPDLITHRNVKKYLIDQKIDQLNEDMLINQKLVHRMNETEKKAVSVERDMTDLKMCEYMSKHIGKTYEGIIVSVLSFGFFVQLDNMVEGLVNIRDLGDYYEYNEKKHLLSNGINNFKMGQKVKVKVNRVDLFKATIDFVLVKRKKNERYCSK